MLQADRVAPPDCFGFFFPLTSQVRDCRLSGLLDLALEKDYVRSKVAEYMNHLIDIGVAGFRIDAAKHMWPGDIKAFLDKLKDLNTQWFSAGTKPFIYQEVISMFSPQWFVFSTSCTSLLRRPLLQTGLGFSLEQPCSLKYFSKNASAYSCRWTSPLLSLVVFSHMCSPCILPALS